jgi:hypothetical protein
VALLVFLAPYAAFRLAILLIPSVGSTIVGSLISALLQAIVLGYVALVITKTFTDASYTRRW